MRFYGEGESAILDRLKKDGTSLLDAFVAQEQIVLRWNSENPGQKLVAVYPVEGTLWADHPLALLERYSDFDSNALTNAQRDTYYEFARYLLTDSVQKQVLAGGYRPVNTQIDLQGDGSPFKSNPAVDALQPKTTLQIPPYSVIQVIEDFQAYIKKPTNVILVVDTSGSMADASKLPRAQTALVSFISNIKGKNDRLGLIEFSDRIKYNSGLKPVTTEYKDGLSTYVMRMTASGNTAVYDGVLAAYEQLQSQGDPTAINAIVVMTDGKENASKRTNLGKLQKTLTGGKVPVVVFSIAFGKDADTNDMKGLAEIDQGPVPPGGNLQYRRALQDHFDLLLRAPQGATHETKTGIRPHPTGAAALGKRRADRPGHPADRLLPPAVRFLAGLGLGRAGAGGGDRHHPQQPGRKRRAVGGHRRSALRGIQPGRDQDRQPARHLPAEPEVPQHHRAHGQPVA